MTRILGEQELMMKRTTAIALFLCVLPATVSAHSFARYVSTPISPPKEFVWWFPVATAILLVGAFLIIWRLLRRHWLAAIGLSLCAVALFAIPFFMFGRFSASVSTAPPPGLGSPHPTFWGMGWRRVGSLFVRWNIYGYGFLLCSLFLCGGVRRTIGRFKKLAIWVLALYAIAIIPYLATGALVHGWAGGYVHNGCQRRLEILNSALVEYADKHDGQFPTADGIEFLLEELEPHLSQDVIRYSVPLEVCPLGGAYERQPKSYVWDASFSGARLQDVDPNRFFQEKAPISCPYHEHMGGRAAFTLTERIFDARDSKDPNNRIDGD